MRIFFTLKLHRWIAGEVTPNAGEISPKTQPFGPVFIEFLSSERDGNFGRCLRC